MLKTIGYGSSNMFVFRCIAVNSLGIYLYEELTHGTLHSKFIEAVNVLLATLGVSFIFHCESTHVCCCYKNFSVYKR